MSVARKVTEERIHAVKCVCCAKSGTICTGKEGIMCMPCRDRCKGCKYATHRWGSKSFSSFLVDLFANTLLVVQARAAAVAVARVASTSESVAVAGPLLGAQVLIRCPRTTPLSSSSELSSNSGEEEESPTGRESEGGRCEREESIDAGVIDPLIEADAAAEDLILEGRLRTLWACMSTMHSTVLELMSEVELINLELKKRRSL
jgi:hypothetical protein